MDNNYRKIGYDAFLNRGPGKVSDEISSIPDAKTRFKSALDSDSETEKLSLGQSGSWIISDGKNNRILIGKGRF